VAEIVNLRVARKRRTKANAETVATANRVAFGVSKSAKDLAMRKRSLADKSLEGHKRLDSRDDD
jgi:hypothetical protein